MSATAPKRLPSAACAPLRVAIVTNIPAPYRLPIYALLGADAGLELKLFFCSGREPDRLWDLGELRVPHVYLRERVTEWRGRYIHTNPDVWPQLRAFGPEVVVTTGFNPTHLLAFAYARRHGAEHVAMTDGTAMSESRLSVIHRLVRRTVYGATTAFVGASEGSFALYRQYGIASRDFFKSHLCANNAAFAAEPRSRQGFSARDFDFVFSGRFVAGKLPLFAIDVAAQCARRLGRRVRLLLVGSGELDDAMRQASDAVSVEVDAHFAGFARQAELPALYASARVALFPTAGDTWGVVANEACAAGVPVLVSPEAGVAGDLVRDGENGHVLALDTDLWAGTASRLLSDEAAWTRYSERCHELVAECSYDNAARGLAAAVRHAAGRSAGTAGATPRRRVVLMQRRMTQYRVALFDRMRALLASHGVGLDVVYGDPLPSEALRSDGGHLDWGRHVPCRYWFGGRLCWWQWAWPDIRQADLVIVTQENKLLINHLLHLLRFWVPLAFWGHGRNFQSTAPQGLRERVKRILARRVDWWFAYTESSAEVVRQLGFPADRITSVNNSTDLASLQQDLAALSDGADRCRAELGLAPGPVALVLASLHADKHIEFTIEAMRIARSSVPDLQLLIVGDGPTRASGELATRGDPWIRWAGARHGEAKARCLRVASVLVNPFGVGLGVLDGFVAGVPLLTTASWGHGPEFAYLNPGRNCVIAPAEPGAFAVALCELLGDAPRHAALAKAARDDAQALTLDQMTERFCAGILECLTRQAHNKLKVAW